MYIIDEGLPRTPFNKEFKEVTAFEKEYLYQFADQLLITDKGQKERFCIPAISFLINGDLNPHCDVMNPTSYEDDYTVCLNVQISKDNLPSSVLQKVNHELYEFAIPFCLVMYKRKALCYYRDRMNRMHQYINENNRSRNGRSLLVQNIMLANTSLDYVGIFFNTNQRKNLIDAFVKDEYIKGITFPYKKAKFREAIDKLGYYSGLLHVIFLYIYKFRVDADECLSMILFFGLQKVSSTLPIVTVLLEMVRGNNNSYRSDTTFYNLLVEKSTTMKNSNSDITDSTTIMNSGHEDSPYNILNPKEVVVHLVSINKLFAKARTRMGLLKPSDTKRKFKLYVWLQTSLTMLSPKIQGLSLSNATSIIELAALIGMIQLDYYTNVPIQYNQETLKFINVQLCGTRIEDTNNDYNKKRIVDLTIVEMTSLQDIFTKEYTANMNNNLISILSREKMRSDYFYYLPWLLPDKEGISDPRLQLMFKICGSRQNLWRLEAFDGENTISFFGNKVLDAVITYNIGDNGIILKSGHKVNLGILQSVFNGFK